jgi:L-lactate dehydrogenase complex protein LldF
MPDIFHQRIQSALADPQLQAALDGNAERRQKAFTTSFESLPESKPLLRQLAHTARKRVIDDLERCLEQFTTEAAANGMIVHHAADAKQMVEIVREIARQSGARLVAKSKTMVGEEVHINRHLEADGLQVVETDLGEYIIQLRGEPPAHIITPAVHLNRAQVGRTFEEKLGLPYTTDIPALTAAARRVLRQTFLEADIGISGVNFGVVETGAIVLVTNEGNGRMCTTLPDVHIALMGIERLVETLDDLALMLNMLPRSATGQKLSVYTSLIHGPARAGEEGPSQRHLILLDNGRRALRDSPTAEALYCIRCGACLNACPVFREIGGHAYVDLQGMPTPYPGPIGSVVSPGLFGLAEFGHLARASSLCGACKDACPIDIDLPKLLLRVRAAGDDLRLEAPSREKLPKRSNIPESMRMALGVFSLAARSHRRFSLAQRLAGVFSRLVPGRSGWMRMPAFTGWGFGRDFPRFALQPFSASSLAAELAPGKQGAADRTPLKMIAPSGHPGSQVTANDQAHKSERSTQALVERFTTELHELGGEAILCSRSLLPETVLRLIQAEGLRAIQAWEAGWLPAGLINTLQASGISISHARDPQIRLGLTGALAGIAESGTLILPAGPGRPQTASLLPEIHVAVLNAGDIVERLAEALAQPEIPYHSSLALITGPSRTADIEMTLTIGVHGPGRLVVLILVDD